MHKRLITLTLAFAIGLPAGMAAAKSRKIDTGRRPPPPTACYIYVCKTPPWGTKEDCVLVPVRVPCWFPGSVSL